MFQPSVLVCRVSQAEREREREWDTDTKTKTRRNRRLCAKINCLVSQYLNFVGFLENDGAEEFSSGMPCYTSFLYGWLLLVTPRWPSDYVPCRPIISASAAALESWFIMRNLQGDAAVFPNGSTCTLQMFFTSGCIRWGHKIPVRAEIWLRFLLHLHP